MSPSIMLGKSTTTLFGAIGRTTAATKSIYVPACSLHLSSVIYREGIIDKAKHVADAANKKVGKTLGNAIEGAEHVAETVTHKTEDLKKETTKKSEQLKGSASSVNEELGKQFNQGVGGVHGVEDLANAASQKTEEFKKQAHNATEKLKNKHLSEKTIVDAVKDGVKSVENLVEKTKESLGINAHEAAHRADEIKDEAQLGAKKAANYAQETKDKASNYAQETKDKASNYAQETKNKAAKNLKDKLN